MQAAADLKALDIRFSEEGDDLVIIVKNAGPGVKERLTALLSPVADPVPETVPEEPDAKDPVLRATEGCNIGRYEGMTVSQVLKAEGDKAMANIMYLLQKEMLVQSTDEIVDTLHLIEIYLSERMRKMGDPFTAAHESTPDAVDDFFKYFSFLFPEEDVKGLYGGKTEPRDLKAFIAEAPEETKRDAMAKILKRMSAYY